MPTEADNKQDEALMHEIQATAKKKQNLQVALDDAYKKKAHAENTVSVDGIDNAYIINLYNKKFSKNPDGTPNPKYQAPLNREGKLNLVFSSANEATSFFSEAVKQNKTFILLDQNKNVIGYSNGDGKLRHADGNEVKSGESLKLVGTIPFDKFDQSVMTRTKPGSPSMSP